MPGGWVNNPPENIQAAVKKAIPALPIERFNRVASMYWTEYHHETESQASVRERMVQIGEHSAKLWINLGGLSEEARDALFEGAYRAGMPNADAFEVMLERLMSAARFAEMDLRDAPPGRSRGALAGLVSWMAGIFEAYGIDATAAPRGDLVFAVESVLEGYGHSSAPAQKAVQRHLDKMRNFKG